MDFNLKQWRDHSHQQEPDQEQAPTKLPRRLLDPHPQPQQHPPSASYALPLFVTEPTSKLTSNLSAYTPDHSTTATATKFSRMGCYFSLAQWQELELQALIYRHMLAGAAVPPELLHLVKKSLINSSHPYFLPHPFQHYQHLQPAAALLQSGYWGRGAMDLEPGRCRRTDGKKWRCSRDVVAGQKYCERHMHRGRNRSRKPVEIPTTATVSGSNAGAGMLKVSSSISTQPLTATAGVATSENHFAYSGPSPSIDLLHLSQRSSESMVETHNHAFGNEKSGGQVLRHFFDDWPRSLQDSDNAGSSASSVTSTTNIAVSDFSLKLCTGDGNDSRPQAGNVVRNRSHLDWSASWGTSQVAPMGGPLAEALRSSTSNSSPTSVLHHLTRASATSEASYISS